MDNSTEIAALSTSRVVSNLNTPYVFSTFPDFAGSAAFNEVEKICQSLAHTKDDDIVGSLKKAFSTFVSRASSQ